MKKILVLTSLMVSGLIYAGEGPLSPKAECPKGCTSLTPECPAGCVPTVVPPKVPVKPKPKPAPKPVTPKPVEPKKEDCKPVERVVKTTVYLDREVSVVKKNHVYFLLGRGPGGMVTDHYSTKERDGEFAMRTGQMGAIITGLYARNLNETWSIIGGASSTLPKPSLHIGIGADW